MTLLQQPITERNRTLCIDSGWQCCVRPPASVEHPDQLTDDAAEWIPAEVPGTVASALQSAGRWDFAAPIDLDAFDWWFRTEFSAAASDSNHPRWLYFDGLATLAEVWLNGEPVLTTDNMFRSYRVDVSSMRQTSNELAIVFRSLKHDLQRKRPRPKWKTNLVQHQQLRWRRTSLLGRIPGWSPPVPPIGPWREIRLVTGPVQLQDRRISTRCDGGTGIVSVNARIIAGIPLSDAELHIGGSVHSLDIIETDCEIALSGEGASPIRPCGGRTRTARPNCCLAKSWSRRLIRNGIISRAATSAFATWKSTPATAVSESASTACRSSAAAPAGR